jgi:fido (protein-threonine AMPylation protein)
LVCSVLRGAVLRTQPGKNGRAQREFVSHLAHANGYYIAWEDASRTDMLAAAIQSFHGDTSKLAALIRENLCGLERDE